ncbi:hypothetical protein [Algoriphagus sp.]|uniref:hypothetical protein n=1 Tax=Algoriphagus sp. TaxID=1872435 RepID=UPI0025D60B0A|nr:hypothetical protein [Algoriphagus sp.]
MNSEISKKQKDKENKWNKTKILSENRIDKSFQPYFNNIDIKIPRENSAKVGSEYSWWTKKVLPGKNKQGIYWANGWDGRKIIVVPNKNVVVVFIGGRYNS